MGYSDLPGGIRMAQMVDIGEKSHVRRRAKASGFIALKEETIDKIRAGEVPKGDALTVAETAGIMAVKRTPETLPLTHPIPVTSADVNFEVEDGGVRAEVEVKSIGQTGVEMEALTGLTTALLTIWDMIKGFEKDDQGQYPSTRITDVRVIEKVKE